MQQVNGCHPGSRATKQRSCCAVLCSLLLQLVPLPARPQSAAPCRRAGPGLPRAGRALRQAGILPAAARCAALSTAPPPGASGSRSRSWGRPRTAAQSPASSAAGRTGRGGGVAGAAGGRGGPGRRDGSKRAATWPHAASAGLALPSQLLRLSQPPIQPPPHLVVVQEGLVALVKLGATKWGGGGAGRRTTWLPVTQAARRPAGRPHGMHRWAPTPRPTHCCMLAMETQAQALRQLSRRLLCTPHPPLLPASPLPPLKLPRTSPTMRPAQVEQAPARHE